MQFQLKRFEVRKLLQLMAKLQDISHLTSKHIPLVERLYNKGIEMVKNANIPQLKGKNVEDYIISG
jgi:hypothetical protein